MFLVIVTKSLPRIKVSRNSGSVELRRIAESANECLTHSFADSAILRGFMRGFRDHAWIRTCIASESECFLFVKHDFLHLIAQSLYYANTYWSF